MKKLAKIIVASLAVLGLAACSSTGSALDSLQSSELSQKYNNAFWTNEASKNTALWQQAFAYCAVMANRSNPNCHAYVIPIHMLGY